MRVLYVCRAVDHHAAFTAAQVEWIRTLAAKPGIEHVDVLTPKAGDVLVPSNVTMRQFAGGRSSIRLAVSFWREVLRARPFRQDVFFVVQGGPFPLLLLPFKLLTRRPVYQWKAQPHVSRRMRFYAKYCDDLVFTATERSLLITLPTKRVVGHGIDVALFSPLPQAPTRDFVTVGRISPIKHVDQMIRAIAAHRDRYAVTPRLDVIGRLSKRSSDHLTQLEALVDELDLADHVRFLGHVDYRDLPALLPRYRASLNFSSTAFDKAVGEAMACGVPVVTTNPAVVESLPPELHEHLVTALDDVQAQAATLHEALSWDASHREWLGHRLRDFVVETHSLEALFDRILEEIRQDQGWSSPRTSSHR